MNFKIAFLGLSVFATAIPLTGCSDDDDPTADSVPAVCKEAFQAKYPQATNPKWEKEGVYYTAEWSEAAGLTEKEAWFSLTQQASDSWAMTETDYGKDFFLAPAGLNTAFNKTEYRNATVDDISFYEYPQAEKNVYVIEATPYGQTNDLLLIFSGADYSFVKAVPDTNADITPETVF